MIWGFFQICILPVDVASTFFFLYGKNRPHRDASESQLSQTLFHEVNVENSSDPHLKLRQLLFLVSSRSALITKWWSYNLDIQNSQRMHVSTHRNDPDVQHTNSHAELSSGPHQQPQWDVCVCQQSLLPRLSSSQRLQHCLLPGNPSSSQQGEGEYEAKIVNMTIIWHRSSAIAWRSCESVGIRSEVQPLCEGKLTVLLNWAAAASQLQWESLPDKISWGFHSSTEKIWVSGTNYSR